MWLALSLLVKFGWPWKGALLSSLDLVLQLKSQLQKHQERRSGQSITKYIQKLKHLSDSLAPVSCPVDDEDMILHTLNGPPQDYAAFKTSIRTRSAPITIKELHALLLGEELHLDSAQQSVLDYSTAALMSSKENNKNSFGKNNKYSGKANSNYNSNNYRGKGRVVGTIKEAKGGRRLNQDPILKILVGDSVAKSAIGQGTLLWIVSVEWTIRISFVILHHVNIGPSPRPKSILNGD